LPWSGSRKEEKWQKKQKLASGTVQRRIAHYVGATCYQVGNAPIA